jgi:polyisoprenyl-phosphate glycosyltransferase
VVIPCYNEAENIQLIMARFGNVIMREDVEVIFVNNGSTDNSRILFQELAPRYSFARIINIPVNQGYGHGIVSGLREARGSFIGWSHGDMQTDPGDTIRALDIIEAHHDREDIFIKGRRKGRPAIETFFTSCMSMFETLYLQTQLWDINAQPNVFHRQFFERWLNPPNDFSLDLYTLYLAHVCELEIIRFPVKFTPRKLGESKWDTGGFKSKYKFIRRTLDYSMKLKKELRTWNS